MISTCLTTPTNVRQKIKAIGVFRVQQWLEMGCSWEAVGNTISRYGKKLSIAVVDVSWEPSQKPFITKYHDFKSKKLKYKTI
jgi:hypothetical protein